MSGTAQKHTPAFEFHQGEDYAVIMRPEQTTDNALVLVKYPDDDDIAALKMMAAALDLLAALGPFAAMAKSYDDMIDTPEEIEFTVIVGDGEHTKRRITREDFMAARAAIAKAEGRS